MTQHGDPQSSSTERSGDDFRKIEGIGRVIEGRLWDAGILTYSDLGQRTPEELAAMLPSTAGISAERIASQDWTGQARALAESAPQPSVSRQHYATFHVQCLLESDNSVRGTRVHHLQTDARDAWAGWDEEKLLIFLRDRIPLPAAATPTNALDVGPTETPPDEPTQTQARDQEPARVEPALAGRPPAPVPDRLPPLTLTIEELALIREGQRSHHLSPNEPSSVRLTMRISPIGAPINDTFDFSAAIVARRFAGHDRSPVGATHGTVRVSDPVSVEMTGPALPADLYRLVATVEIYSADHSPEEPPLYRMHATGDLMRVADTPLGSAPAVA